MKIGAIDKFFISFYLVLLVVIVVFSINASETNTSKSGYYYENTYRDMYCSGIPVRLQDGTECDCATKKHAIEYEWASKWKSGIGQTLHYAKNLRLKPGIFLLCKSDKDLKYVRQCKILSDWLKHNYAIEIDVWFKMVHQYEEE